MTRHYTTRDLFRQMPHHLLALYFAGQAECDALAAATVANVKTAELFELWLQLPDSRRNSMDSEFRDMFELSNEKGFRAILDEAEYHFTHDHGGLAAFALKLGALANHFERAMVTYLDHSAFWKGAGLLNHADSLPYWRKRKNFPHTAAAVDEDSINTLAQQIGSYFHRNDGRGKNCVVEPFKRGELDYFFAYPEDYSQQSVEWVNGAFDRRPHNPAFEIVFVYSQKEGSLDVNVRGAPKAIEPLQGMFATVILKLDALPPNAKDKRVYDLAPLSKKSFEFLPAAGSGIGKVVVKKIRLSSRVKKGDRITVEADTIKDADAVNQLVLEIAKSIPLHQYSVTQIELTASVVDGDKPPRDVTFTVTHPNSCSLKYDPVHMKLREMLEASGIELKEPSEHMA